MNPTPASLAINTILYLALQTIFLEAHWKRTPHCSWAAPSGGECLYPCCISAFIWKTLQNRSLSRTDHFPGHVSPSWSKWRKTLQSLKEKNQSYIFQDLVYEKLRNSAPLRGFLRSDMYVTFSSCLLMSSLQWIFNPVVNFSHMKKRQ